MGKKLYGSANTKSLRKRPTRGTETYGDTDDDDGESCGWLTLAPAATSALEDAREKKMELALGEAFADNANAIALAGSLVEYGTSADNRESWIGVIEEMFTDAGLPLSLATDTTDVDEVEDAPPTAAEVVDALCKRNVLVTKPPPLPDPREGDPVLALLDEDGEWHAAVIAAVEDGGRQLIVRFLQWAKLQPTARKHVVPLAAVADEEFESDDDGTDQQEERQRDAAGRKVGACCLCSRAMQLTFHHLIPKQLHKRYLGGRALPKGLPTDAEPTRSFLGQYGIMICRPCHSVVHRSAPNAILAERFCTLETLREAPAVAKWIAYAAGVRSANG